MRSPGSVPEEERDWTENASLKIDDGIEYASQALDAGMQKMNEVTDKALTEGTQTMSNAIGGAVKSVVDFSKEKFTSLADKASSIDSFKDILKSEGKSDGEAEFSITKESDIKGFTEPDQLQDSLVVSMAEHTTSSRMSLDGSQAFISLADKRQQEVESAKEISMLNASKPKDDVKKAADKSYDRYAEVDALSTQLEAGRMRQNQANADFEDSMMSPKGVQRM